MKRPQSRLEADIVIIGAGVAGLSTAYHLSLHSKAKILVLEQEKVLGGHASGRNAGMIRQTVGDPVIAQMARQGRSALQSAFKKGWKSIRFLANGSLLLAQKDKLSEIQKIKASMEILKVPARWMTAEQAAKKVPFLKNARFEKALFCPGDALVENKPLLKSFYREITRRGVRVLMGETPRKITREKGLFHIHLENKTVVAPKLVNAAGAWCALLAENAGAQKIPLTPYRRHLYVSGALGIRHSDWPFVWDLSHDFYFRPEGKGLLLSPCDKKPVNPKSQSQRKETADAAVRNVLFQKLADHFPAMSRLRIESEKSGLRTMTPDGRFVIGEDSALPFFYWVAGLGGHGVTTCFSVGKLSSDIILGRKADSGLAKAFSPKRFFKGQK